MVSSNIRRSIVFLSILFTSSVVVPVQAITITIGKGSGIVWEGLPFSQTMTGPMSSAAFNINYGLLSISDSTVACINRNKLVTIAGYEALQIAPGVALVPRATGIVTYVRSDNTNETLTGTIGVPNTSGTTTANAVITNPLPNNYTWCLTPQMTSLDPFYSASGERTATLTGTWLLVVDGSQTSGEFSIPEMFAGSYSARRQGDRFVSILPKDINLRISTLACTISTQTAINFGGVERKTTEGDELASLSSPMNVACSQDSGLINANINVQFRPSSGLFNGNPHRLSLNQGGGYITGEINNKVTGSGACNLNTGITFDNTPFLLGSIAITDTTKAFSNMITWRLCSGGANLPIGPVTAATDMLVTFN